MLGQLVAAEYPKLARVCAGPISRSSLRGCGNAGRARAITTRSCSRQSDEVSLAAVLGMAAATAGMLALPAKQSHSDMAAQMDAMMKGIEAEHGHVAKKDKPKPKRPPLVLPIKLDGDDPEKDYKFKHVIGKGAIGIVRLAI